MPPPSPPNPPLFLSLGPPLRPCSLPPSTLLYGQFPLLSLPVDMAGDVSGDVDMAGDVGGDVDMAGDVRTRSG